MLYLLLRALEDVGGPAVFRYVTSRSALAFIFGFIVVLAIGRPLINLLYRRGVRSFERSYGDLNTTAKTGTPIMGGLLMALGGLGSALLWCDLTNPFVWMLFAAAIYFAGFGVLDDWLKIRHRDPDRGIGRGLKLGQPDGLRPGHRPLPGVAGDLAVPRPGRHPAADPRSSRAPSSISASASSSGAPSISRTT